MKKSISPRQIREEWELFYAQFVDDTDVEISEDPIVKAQRQKRLIADPEEWFRYYFPKYCTAPSAPFHRQATKRLLNHPKWYEVRAWSRELAKSARSMMEILYLALNGKIRNMLLVSNSYDNAERLLTPFMLQLERNSRIKNDYGLQVTEGKWESGEFVARCGCSFRALGAGQSPRGTRNEAARPDFILVDDIDTDEECRNPDRIRQKWEWIEQALIPTVSISGNARFLFNGNIIAKDCCITRAIKMADHTDVVNIRNKDGRSSWPEKNSEEDIDRILSKMSAKAAQQEYYNNPMADGEVFKELTWGKVPPLSKFKFLVIYGDPAPSENKTKMSSTKAVWLCGKLAGTLYVIRGFLDRGSNAEFIDWYAQLSEFVGDKTTVYSFIENNKLQDPFYQQVFKPIVAQRRKELEATGRTLHILPDEKKKTDKATRIEAHLEPLNRNGQLVFNEAERKNPHMQRLTDQFSMFTMQLKFPADGPDCIEGADRMINDKMHQMQPTVTVSSQTFINQNKKRI